MLLLPLFCYMHCCCLVIDRLLFASHDGLSLGCFYSTARWQTFYSSPEVCIQVIRGWQWPILVHRLQTITGWWWSLSWIRGWVLSKSYFCLRGGAETGSSCNNNPHTLCSRHNIYSSSQSLRKGQEETPKWIEKKTSFQGYVRTIVAIAMCHRHRRFSQPNAAYEQSSTADQGPEELAARLGWITTWLGWIMARIYCLPAGLPQEYKDNIVDDYDNTFLPVNWQQLKQQLTNALQQPWSLQIQEIATQRTRRIPILNGTNRVQNYKGEHNKSNATTSVYGQTIRVW